MISGNPEEMGPAKASTARPRSGYSIGAVAAMLGVPPATLRTWEERYGVVSPDRTQAGQRLYSRAQLEDLRFVASEMKRGMSAADAHRLALSDGRSIRYLWPAGHPPRGL